MSWQKYQSNQSDRGYQGREEKEVYHVDNKVTEHKPKSFHTTFELEEEELAYSDEGFNKIFANFVGI